VWTVLTSPSRSFLREHRRAQRERAGLVEGDGVDPVGELQQNDEMRREISAVREMIYSE